MDSVRELVSASRVAWLRSEGSDAWAALDRADALTVPGSVDELRAMAGRARILASAERLSEALELSERCLSRAGTHCDNPDAAGPIADATVTAATCRGLLHPSDPTIQERSLRELQAVAASAKSIRAGKDDELDVAVERAVSNALGIELARAEAGTGTRGESHSEAWTAVARARSVIEMTSGAGTVLRQAVDLSFATGDWERGWDYVHQAVDREGARNERVALLAKAALLAWERGLLIPAQELGERCVQSSVGADLPWVRLYAYLGGVVAAAAGGGNVKNALNSYRLSTTIAGHRSRPHRAWEAAQVALDAGTDTDQIRSFLRSVLPAGMPSWLDHLTSAVLADADEHAPGPADLDAALELPLSPGGRARILIVRARDHRREDRKNSAVLDLHTARQLLHAWPGRITDTIERELAVIGTLTSPTPAQSRVLALMLEGWSNERIAAKLGCSPRTVAVHVSAMLAASGASSRTDLVAHELCCRITESR
ncbi:MAG: LuxR C-terminal-related transcriptional regulator [Nakamurella sp.]